ncbi:hypothetical protein N7481_003440 [Penicillium waksmanii]|uniref:uncharacterized protein n=1 Tax=Penicillium waksmanii TaxID=69791 RepID=UPI0025478F82|nr:uncharacterized protein N7481_003440 [Penicillium waksmanii]KAJ5988230.1 hypothetical protein N7481_003440 [Penicillium waksmanii]
MNSGPVTDSGPLVDSGLISDSSPATDSGPLADSGTGDQRIIPRQNAMTMSRIPHSYFSVSEIILKEFSS